MPNETANQRWWADKVGVPLERSLLRLVDHHAEPLRISRRALVRRTLEEYVADAAALVAAEQRDQADEALDRLSREGER